MNARRLAEQYQDYIIERRRWYHKYPELSREEAATRAAIRQDLLDLGITDIREMRSCYGLIADIHGGAPGKTVALRTDIDALCVREETGLPFASVHDGKMHACGHDAHIAILLGAAKILNETKAELRGTVRLLVQPEEEVAEGARKMMDEGALDGVDAIYGGHVWGTLDAPYIDFTPGNRMASCHSFEIEVEGVSAHGSSPQLGVDAVAAAAAIINALQQCVSLQNDPLNPLVLTIGTINGGSRFNVIANRVTMTGTVRTFLPGTEIEDRMRRVIAHTAEALGAKATLSYHYLTSPLINADDTLNRLARAAVTKLYGPESLGHLGALMASEDFGWYGQTGIPYVWGFLGSHDPACAQAYTNHHEKYDIDEAILPRGSAVMAQFAADFLAEA